MIGGSRVNKLEVYFLFLTLDFVCWSSSSFCWIINILDHYCTQFCHSLLRPSKYLFKVFFLDSSCSRPICVEAITVRRANKSVPSEKLPESGQLPSNLPPGHQSISLLCPPNPWLPPFQWDPQAPQYPPNPKVKLGIGFVRQMFNATFSMT